jgi:hypothetical protein
LNLSAITPENGPKTIDGIADAISTSEIDVVEPVNE